LDLTHTEDAIETDSIFNLLYVSQGSVLY